MVVAGPVAAPWCCTLTMGVSRLELTATLAANATRRLIRRRYADPPVRRVAAE
jgi:hypothetical protein